MYRGAPWYRFRAETGFHPRNDYERENSWARNAELVAAYNAYAERFNADHAAGLADMARALGGYPDTESAVCTGIDRYGLDLKVRTPRGEAYTRVGFGGPLSSADELRSATADLVRQARA